MNTIKNAKQKIKITPRTDVIFRNIFGKKGNEAIYVTRTRR